MPVKRDTYLSTDVKNGVGVITLNRPDAKNAMTLEMIRDFDLALEHWAADPAVKLVLVRHRGQYFCTGADMDSMHSSLLERDNSLVADYFREEYILNRHIFHFPKPYVSVLNGVVRGDGVGIGLFGSTKIVTEHTSISLSETDSGFITDGGASYLLSRFPGHTGSYLGLTGAEIRYQDALFLGIATHFVKSEHIAQFEEHIMAGGFSEKAPLELQELLRPYAKPVEESPLMTFQPEVDRCFNFTTLEEVLFALASGKTSWHQKTLELLTSRSPTSLKATHRLIRAARRMSFDDALQLEFRVAQHMMRHPDYLEGIRAFVADKDDRPTWRPDLPEAVSTARIDSFFEPLPEGELNLKIKDLASL